MSATPRLSIGLPVYNGETLLGYAFWTTEILPLERAYGGPIAILVGMDPKGILSGIVLVFIPIMGEYLIPILLGGGKTYFLGNALADLFLQSRNWPFGSALAAVFVAGMIVLVAGYLAVSRRLVRAGRESSLI